MSPYSVLRNLHFWWRTGERGLNLKAESRKKTSSSLVMIGESRVINALLLMYICICSLWSWYDNRKCQTQALRYRDPNYKCVLLTTEDQIVLLVFNKNKNNAENSILSECLTQMCSVGQFVWELFYIYSLVMVTSWHGWVLPRIAWQSGT